MYGALSSYLACVASMLGPLFISFFLSYFKFKCLNQSGIRVLIALEGRGATATKFLLLLVVEIVTTRIMSTSIGYISKLNLNTGRSNYLSVLDRSIEELYCIY